MPPNRDSAQPALLKTPESRQQLERLQLLATWLDRRFVDPLVGLFFPGAGDALGSILGLYGVFVAIRLGVHPIVVARMLLNLGIDALVGGIPVLGSIFDLFYQAHVRNLNLLQERGSHGKPTWGDWFIVGAASSFFLVALALPLLLVAFLVWLLAS